jgi:hypothetical protein
LHKKPSFIGQNPKARRYDPVRGIIQGYGFGRLRARQKLCFVVYYASSRRDLPLQELHRLGQSSKKGAHQGHFYRNNTS